MDNMNDNKNLEEQNNVENNVFSGNNADSKAVSGNVETINNVSQSNMTNNSKRKNIIIVCCVIVVACACILFIVFNNIKNNSSNNVGKDNTENKENDNSDNNSNDDLKYILTIYKDDKSVFFTVPTESKDAEILDKVTDDTHGYVLYKDNNKIKVYNSSDKSIKILNGVNTSYDNYFLVKDVDNNANPNVINDIIGVSTYNNNIKNKDYADTNSCQYYDLKQNKSRYSGYCVTGILQNSDFLEAYNNITFTSSGDFENGSFYVLKKNEDNVVVKADKEVFSGNFWIENGFIGRNSSWIETHNVTLYSMSGERLTPAISTEFIDTYQNKAYYYLDNELVVINNSGKIVQKQAVNGYKIALVSRNYAFAIKDSKVVAINLEDFTEYNLANYDSSYGDIDLFEMSSGYVPSERAAYEKYGEGYYIYFSESTLSVYFNPDTKKIENWNREI